MTQGTNSRGFPGLANAAPAAAVAAAGPVAQVQAQARRGSPYTGEAKVGTNYNYLPAGTMGVEIVGVKSKQGDVDGVERFIVDCRVLQAVANCAPVGYEGSWVVKVKPGKAGDRARGELVRFFAAIHGQDPRNTAVQAQFADIVSLVDWATSAENPAAGMQAIVSIEKRDVKDPLTKLPVIPATFFYVGYWEPSVTQ